MFWQPVYPVLEDGRLLLLVNPQHIKALPGRKTDVKESEWIADLFRHGLLKASFVPPKPIREWRQLTRYRKTLIQERAQESNRLQKVREGANLKVAAVATEVLGKSGRDRLEAVIGGEQDAEVLAELARGKLRAKRPALRQALAGRIQPHHRFLLERLLAPMDFLEESLVHIQQEGAQRLGPSEEAMRLVQRIPGMQEVAAAAIISEIGVQMERFPSAKHLASWAGVGPGNKQSGGKRLSGATRMGNTSLRAMLGEVAWSISRMKDKYLAAQDHRLARRRGREKALVAVSHSLLVISDPVLREKQPYTDLGADYFDKLDTARIEPHHVRRLEHLGYPVTLTPAPAA